MALVPPLARVGDMVVHVRGCCIPIMLRPTVLLGGKRAELVGVCTVLGMNAASGEMSWDDWFLE
jgi:hypothetical protein